MNTAPSIPSPRIPPPATVAPACSTRPGRGGDGDRVQLTRFEFKYVVSESAARSMRQFVRCHLRPDEFSAGRPEYAYAVHTLYLDSPRLSLYQATNTGEKNRFKLRVRFYDDGPDAPAFFEIKRRRNDGIEKHRACVRREAVRPLLRGEWPALRHLRRPDVRQLGALQEFHGLMQRLRATPRSHVAYQREAWMSAVDNSMRVTFDRHVQCEPQFEPDIAARIGEAVTAFPNQVILELKFTGRLPHWCFEFVRAFNLVRRSAAKYAEGVALMGEDRISNCGVALRVPDADVGLRVPDRVPGPEYDPGFGPGTITVGF